MGGSLLWPGGRDEPQRVSPHVAQNRLPPAELQIERDRDPHPHHPTRRPRPRPSPRLIRLPIPVDPHASVVPVHEKRIQRLFFFSSSSFFPDPGWVLLASSALNLVRVVVAAAPSPPSPPPTRCHRSSLAERAQLVTDKVHSFFRDVQERRRARPERRRKRDAVVARTDRDFPAEAAGKRNGDVPRVGTDLNVEIRTWSVLPVWAMLKIFIFYLFFSI